MTVNWDIERIRKILPHKYPFIFIDKMVELDGAQGRIVCVKNLTVTESYFTGHFPGNPVMPGVLIIEAMAQASILLYSVLFPEIAAAKPDYLLGKVEAKFVLSVKPGDRLIIEVTKEKIIKSAGVVTAVAKVKEQTVAKADISFGVKVN